MCLESFLESLRIFLFYSHMTDDDEAILSPQMKATYTVQLYLHFIHIG